MQRFLVSLRVTSLLTRSIILVCLTTAPLHAQRRDLVVMKNGDQLTGELKKLENGILYFKPPYVSDSIQLDWLQVKTVQSSAAYQIVLENGQHLVGMISSSPELPGGNFELKVSNGGLRVTFLGCRSCIQPGDLCLHCKSPD
jgi:hypothetical protein